MARTDASRAASARLRLLTAKLAELTQQFNPDQGSADTALIDPAPA